MGIADRLPAHRAADYRDHGVADPTNQPDFESIFQIVCNNSVISSRFLRSRLPFECMIQNRDASETICSGGGNPMVCPIFSCSTAEPLVSNRPFKIMTLPKRGASTVTSVLVRSEKTRSLSSVMSEFSAIWHRKRKAYVQTVRKW